MSSTLHQPSPTSGQVYRNTVKCIKEQLSPAHKKKLWWMSILILVSSVLDVFGLASVLPLIKAGSDTSTIHTDKYLKMTYDFFGFSTDKQFLLFLVLAVLVFQIVKSAFGLFVNYIQGIFMADVATHISRNQFSKYFSLSYFDFTTVKSSDIVNRVQQNPSAFVSWVLLPLLSLFAEMLILLLIIGMIAIYNIKLFFFILITIGPTSAIIYLLLKNRAERVGRSITHIYPQALSQITYSLMGYIDIRLSNKTEFYREKFLHYQKKYHDLNMSSIILNMIPLRSNEMVAIIGVVAIFVYAIFFNDQNQDVIMLVGAFSAAAYRLMPSVNRILNALMYISRNQGAIEHINAHNDAYVANTKMNRNVAIPFNKDIHFNNISFTFPKGKHPVLDNLSFTVKKGEKIGFVGMSGSGKTTLMNLLLRFYIEDSGSIDIDGKPLKEENLDYWRNLIGYVKQDIFLFDTTMRENIAFGDDNIDEERLALAVKQASLDKFISTLPKGLDTEVGERGTSLSGGQRQRIGIARALYRNAQVLIFDEATSALDTQTEQEVSEAIDALSTSNRTIFIIAHRITTLKNCDRIIELKHGKISGVHQYNELVEKIMN
ncbi:MAG TPA: ABC transporter ATP-binding protein [Bacteroidia bacterium]|nr:ABC transporter ATP-binding protein [Bacteroidia bacterium]HNU32151.1 ABC transporter ATP-binding protein [Bacteroidia bacterium]